jgi:DNA-binding NarL/FixJ family response regulator
LDLGVDTSARILIVDDHEVLREGLKSLFAKIRPAWKICGEAADGDEGVQFAQELKPDLIVLDVSMPRMSGIEALLRIRKLGLRTPVLIFTTHHSDRLAADVRRAGAQGYVVKSEASRKLVLAMDTLLAGGIFFGALSEPASADNEPNPGVLPPQSAPPSPADGAPSA